MSNVQDITSTIRFVPEALNYGEIIRRVTFLAVENKAKDVLQFGQFGNFQPYSTSGTTIICASPLVAVYVDLEKHFVHASGAPVDIIPADVEQWAPLAVDYLSSNWLSFSSNTLKQSLIGFAPDPVEKPSERDREKFQRLVVEWKRGRGHSSKIKDLVLHTAYQQIIGMGARAIPLLLEEMKVRPSHWSWALAAITGIDPVPRPSRGKLKEVAQYWLKWGAVHGYDQ